MTDADGFPTMIECRCGIGEPEGPQPDCRVHGCTACIGRMAFGHADGCRYLEYWRSAPDDIPLSWIFR